MATRKGGSSGGTARKSAKKSGGARKRADERKRAGGAASSRGRKAVGKGAGRKAAGKSQGRSSAGKRAGRKSAPRKGGGRARAPRMNAIAMLKDDHQRVQEMFDRFERARSDEQKQQLADRICEELTIHAEVEEEIFYPAVREATGDEDLVDEAEVEHQSAKDLIAQIQAGKMGDPQWEAKVKVLGEYVKHHVKEEQNEMFPKARKANLDLRALGEQIAARKAGEPMPGAMGAQGGEGSSGGQGSGGRERGEEGEEGREPGLIESAVRTLLPGGR